MTDATDEIETLAREAASGAGFPPAQAKTFGRAAVLHLATGGGLQALTEALADSENSPILRLPLLVEDMARALALAGPEVSLSLQKGDEALAPAYARLLPVGLRAVQVTRPPDGPARIEITADPGTPPSRPPKRIDLPADLRRSLMRRAS